MDGDDAGVGVDLDAVARRQSREVYRLILRFVADREEALDLTQEVLVRAFLHRHEFRSESSLKTWLYRIAINLCRDEQRRRARRQAQELLAPEALETCAGSGPSALEALVGRERSDDLEQLMQALPQNEYVAVVLHYHAGLPQAQVAEVVEASVPAVESRLRRARERMSRWALRARAPAAPGGHEGQRALAVGRVLLSLRDYRGAVGYLERAASLLPGDPGALCALGTAYWQLHNLDGAWEMGQRALRADAECGEAHNLCGIVYGLRGDYEASTGALRRAVIDERWPGRARAWGNLGTTYALMRRWGEATEALELALELAPDYAVAWSHLGSIHLREGRLAEALRCQDRAVALDPPYYQGHFNRAETLAALGRTEDAIDAYRRASELAPWWVDAHGALGLALHIAGRAEEAERHFAAALAMPGEGGYPAYYKGRVRLVQGDAAGALSEFEDAACKSREWAEPLLWVARLREESGDLAGAAVALRQALEREPDCAEARARLAELGG